MKQIKVRRGIDIAQNLFSNINFNRGRSQPPRTKESVFKQQHDVIHGQTQDADGRLVISPRFTDQNAKSAIGPGQGSKSIIIPDHVGQSKMHGGLEGKNRQLEAQISRIAINHSVAQIQTLSQLNSERGSIHESQLTSNQRPSVNAFSPQRAGGQMTQRQAAYERSQQHRHQHQHQAATNKPKGSSVQPNVGRYRKKVESQNTSTVMQQQDQQDHNQITGRRNTRNFESKLGQAVDYMHGGGQVIAHSQMSGSESQATPHSQQKIVIVGSVPDKRHNTGNSNSTIFDGGSGGKSKKHKRGQKAVVNKYQQIPQSMISNNRPTFQQLEKAQSISSFSEIHIGMHDPETDKTMKHIRQHYQDENYRSSPGNSKIREVGKEAPVVKKFMGPSPSPKEDCYTVDERYSKGFSVPKVPCSPMKPKTKVQFENKPPQLATGDERDYHESPQFTTIQSQHNSAERQKRFGSDGTTPTPDIESQSQHMFQWRRNQFKQDKSSLGVQSYKVLNFRPYQEDGESMNVNNTNMAEGEPEAHGRQRPAQALPLQKLTRQGSHTGTKRSKQSNSSPKPLKNQKQESMQSSEKPRTQSYYQRILNYAKANKRSPKSNQFDDQQLSQKNGLPPPTPSLKSAVHMNSYSELPNEVDGNIFQDQKPSKDRMIASPRGPNQSKITHQSKHNSAVRVNVSVLHQENMQQQKQHQEGDEGDIDQRISDLFSPARGKHDKNQHHQQHNTMTLSQIQNMKNSEEGMRKNNFGEYQRQESEKYQRYTNATVFKMKKGGDAVSLNIDTQTVDNKSQTFQNSREIGSFFAAQSVAMSPSRQIRMYDELLNKTPQSQVHNVKLIKNGPISSSQRSLDRSPEKIEEGKIIRNSPRNTNANDCGGGDSHRQHCINFQNKSSNKNADKPPSNGLFHFRRKPGAVKSNERQQSPRASSKQLLAKQNLSTRLTKPFIKNKSANKSQDKTAQMSISNPQTTELTARGVLAPAKINSQSSMGRNQNIESLIKQVNNAQQQSGNDNHQASILFDSSHNSSELNRVTTSRINHHNSRIAGDSSFSPSRPDASKITGRSDAQDRQNINDIGPNQQGANIDLRIRNKRTFVSNIRQAHQNYINNKLAKKMESNNNNMDGKKLIKPQQSDTPPRHTSKFSMDVSDRDYVSNDFNTTPEKMQKIRTTLNSSKLKDQETASGATKQNSAFLQSSMQGQQIGDGGVNGDEKENADEQDQQNIMNPDDPDQEVKGWAIFKLKSWKNIFAKSNEKSREEIQGAENKTGENNNDTKEDDVEHKKSGVTPQDIVKEEPEKELQIQSASAGACGDAEEGQELQEMKHNIMCDCDKDATYAFACKNGVVWFAANVIMLKIRRQQKLNDKVDVSKIILDEYDKCKKHYKSLKKLKPKQESALQIDRDLGRTFPKNKFFQPGEPGHKKLRNVLRAFSCYDDQADYVQGMNFLVGQLLMHCSATLAFWLFVELIEECELRDIYQVGLPGLHKHSFIINMLVKDHLPDLHRHFEEHNVVPEMYASDWIFGLFASILPENQTEVTAHFFSLFFQYKWEFFYKLILSILEQLKPKLLEAQDMFSILQQIKIAMSNKNDPYTYGLIYQQEQQMQGSQKNRNKYTDHEMEDILGSIVSANEDGADGEGNNHQSQTSLFSNIANFFKKSKDDGGSEPVWQEFPWEQVIVKTDVILKWKKVDMKKINRLHANFDLDTGKFINIEEERQQQEQQAKLGAAIATSLDKHQYNSKE